MLFGNNSIHKTHYETLGVKEYASYEEIRASYRSAILNSHPDKLQRKSEISNPDLEPGDRFLEVQRAWEILSDSRSCAIYDNELRALQQDAVAAEDVSVEDLTVEDVGEVLELFYQCRCGDYFSVDSLELGKMWCTLLRDASEISIQMSDTLPASILLPCGSCSLKVRLLINADVRLPTDDHL